jgi:hypothetical protein
MLAVANCAGRDSLRAEHTGDVSNPPAARASADAALIEACGAGAVADLGAARVRRRPYLQQVTHDGATVVWTSVSTAPSWVEVGETEGSTLVVRADADASAKPVAAHQMVAHIEGLRANAVHCYSVHDDDGELVGAAGFRTAPYPNAPSAVRFVAFGDSGDGGFLQGRLVDQMRAVPFDLALLLGDIAYEEGARLELEANFFGVYQAVTRSFPVYPVAGNHDYGTESAAPLREFFVLPENGGAEGRERWYSFDRGPVHFVGLDTERIGPVQAAWLDADLGATTRPWTVVFAHRPPFSSGYHGNDPSFQAVFLPVLRRHRPTLVLAGHDHHYERFTPIDGTLYFVSGGGGRETRDVDWSERTAFAEPVIHFLYVTADPEQLAVHAIDGTGREFDSLLVRR